MWSLLGSLLSWLLGLFTGKAANRDEELGTVKAENQQMRDNEAVIKKTQDAVDKATKDGGYNDADDLDAVRNPPPRDQP